MPSARGCLGGRISEHAGGPQLPARGQRQLSGVGHIQLFLQGSASQLGAVPPPPPVQRALDNVWRHFLILSLGRGGKVLLASSRYKAGMLLSTLRCLR